MVRSMLKMVEDVGSLAAHREHQVKSALYDADERSMHLAKGAEVLLPEV